MAYSHRLHLNIGLVVALTVLPLASSHAQPQQPETPSENKYIVYQIRGHKVHVSGDVSRYGMEKVNDVLEELQERLEVALDALPSKSAKRLESVRFWLEMENSAQARTSDIVAACYFPLAPNVRLLHQKCGGIEIPWPFLLGDSAKVTKRLNPYWLLHELAHAYHDRVLDYDNKKIKEAYESAMERKLYKEVECKGLGGKGLVVIGKGRAYACKNYAEYFAELSVAYLARNWAYPFTAEDLRKHDPDGYKLMESVWGEKPKQK
jgi:hypothetical protein